MKFRPPMTVVLATATLLVSGGIAYAAVQSVDTRPDPQVVVPTSVTSSTDRHGADDPATHDVHDDHGADDPATHDVHDDHGGASGSDDSGSDDSGSNRGGSGDSSGHGGHGGDDD